MFNTVYHYKKRKTDIGGPPPLQKVVQGSEQDLSGRPAMLKLNQTLKKYIYIYAFLTNDFQKTFSPALEEAF